MDLRYERKYKIGQIRGNLLAQTVLLHPAGFRKVFPDRWVNNIYFDSPDLNAYHDNVAGVSHRKKYRIRWYGNPVESIHEPKLEIKIKENQMGRKEVYDFREFSLGNYSEIIQDVYTLSGKVLPLRPTLLNSYLRSYFTTTDGMFRITVDRQMKYHSLLLGSHFHSYSIYDLSNILELKYGPDSDGHTDRITQYFPYRQTKSSKYVTGIELTL